MNKRYPVQLSALISFSYSNQLRAFYLLLSYSLFHKSAFSFVAEFQYHYIHALRSLSQWDLFHSIEIQLSDTNDVPSQWTNDVEEKNENEWLQVKMRGFTIKSNIHTHTNLWYSVSKIGIFIFFGNCKKNSKITYFRKLNSF